MKNMAWINKPKKKNKEKHYSKKKDKNAEIAHIYNSSEWQKLRNAYYQSHPLCEMCLKMGKVTPTEEIHHVKPISTGNSNSEMRELAYDYNNLMALCKYHHKQIHKEINNKNKKDI